MEYLRGEGVPFTMQQHRTAYTAQEVAASEHLPGDMVAKVVVVYAGPRLVMLVVPGGHRVDLSKVVAVLGAAGVWLAEERELAAAFPDCEPGAMPPFGNLYGMPVYVDRSLGEQEEIVLQAGTHTETIHMAYADFVRLVEPEVVEIVRDALALGRGW